MLVLTRKPQEKIRIGNDITITVIKTKGKTVRLGIEAPSDVTVLRGELEFDLEDHKQPEDKISSSHNNRVKSEFANPCQSESESDARFARTSRSRIQSILPELLGDAGPLRSMLDRRSELTT